MAKGNELAKAGSLTDEDLRSKGIDPGSEDAIAVRSAVEGGMSFDDAVGGLGYATHTDSVGVGGVAAAVSKDAYNQGRMVAKGVQAAQKQGFATGLGDGIREGQAENAEFFRECLEGVKSAFTFGG